VAALTATLPRKVAFRAEHTGGHAQDRAQRMAQQVGVAALEAYPISLMLTANISTTLNTAVSTLLTFAVAAGSCWDIEYYGYSSCSSVNGLALGILCPTGSTLTGELISSAANTAVANWHTQTLTASTLSTALHVGANNNGRPDALNARVTVGLAGSITLQYASITAATTTFLYAKNYLRASKVTLV
jgi:hypothetical protein